MKIKGVLILLFALLLASCSPVEIDSTDVGGWSNRVAIKYDDHLYLQGGPYPYHPTGTLIRLGEVEKVIKSNENFESFDDDLTGHAIPFGTIVYMEEIDGILQVDHLLVLFIGDLKSPTILYLSKSMEDQ